MTFSFGQQIFPLQNPQQTCAAYSQTWLALSLLSGGPLTNPGIISNQVLMSTVQSTAGQPTAVSLNADGMAIIGNPVVMNNVRWFDAFGAVARSGPGYYYITVKNPHHAMACHIDGQKVVHYLEPEIGLYKFSNLGVFVTGAKGWYAARSGQDTNQEFKIYCVGPATG
jgi:hypothetical protein